MNMTISTDQPSFGQFVALWTHQGTPFSSTLRNLSGVVEEFVPFFRNEKGEIEDADADEIWRPWIGPIGGEVLYYSIPS